MFEMNCYLWRHLLSSSNEIKLGVSLQSDYFLDSCPGSGGAENGVVTGLGVGQRWGWSHDHCALERQSVVVVGRDLAVALCSAGERHCPLLRCTAPLSRPSTPPTQHTDTPQLNIALDTYLWAKVRNNGQNYNEPTYWQKIRCCLHKLCSLCSCSWVALTQCTMVRDSILDHNPSHKCFATWSGPLTL